MLCIFLYPAKAKESNSKDHPTTKDKQDRDNNNGDTDDEKHNKEDERRFEPPAACDGDLVDMLGQCLQPNTV